MTSTIPLPFEVDRRSLSDGVSAHVAGPEGAPVVLLVHGVGLRAEAWTPQIAALSSRFRVIAVDMPGHGASAPLDGQPRLAGYVDWMIDVLEHIDLGPVSLAGHSMGSLIAAGVAIERPELVQRVALLNSVYRRDAAARAAVLARADQIAAGEMSPKTPLARWFPDDEGNSAACTLTAEMLDIVNPAGYAAAYRAFAEGDSLYADRLGSVAAPAMVLTGALDANSTAAMADQMAALMPRGQAVVIEAHRHMVNLTAAEAVNAAMLRWMECKI